MKTARDRLKELRATTASFEHVPRERNQWADFLSQVALVLQRDVTLTEALGAVEDPAMKVRVPPGPAPGLCDRTLMLQEARPSR